MTHVMKTMTKTLQLRVDEQLRSEADGVLREIGMDLPSAVRLFLTKVVQTRSIPFDLTASPRFAEVNVDATTQAKMDDIGALWTKKKARRA